MVVQVLTNSLGQFRKHDFLDIKKFLQKNITGSIYNSRFKWCLLIDRKNFYLSEKGRIKNKKLQLRVWKEGDVFRPLGMSGKQKISDFLINEKLNRFEKFNQPVLCADDQIIWLCGHRIDDRYKVSDQTIKYISLNRAKRSIAQ